MFSFANKILSVISISALILTGVSANAEVTPVLSDRQTYEYIFAPDSSWTTYTKPQGGTYSVSDRFAYRVSNSEMRVFQGTMSSDVENGRKTLHFGLTEINCESKSFRVVMSFEPGSGRAPHFASGSWIEIDDPNWKFHRWDKFCAIARDLHSKNSR